MAPSPLFPLQIRVLSISPNSKFVVSAGHDKTIRLWELSEEVLVLDDERETEREKEGDQELATGEDRAMSGGDQVREEEEE